jgi:PAS domain S-box-containing protein
MSEHLMPENERNALRAQIVGLNDQTLRKSYFPQLQKQIEELKRARASEEEKSAALEVMVKDLQESRAQTEASERKFRTLANFTNDIEYWTGPDEKIIYISPSCERLTGYSQSEFEANSDLLNIFVHPDDRPLIAIHSTREPIVHPHTVDLRIVTRQGEIRWFAHTCQSIFDEDGQWLGRRGSSLDITARKAAEARVQRLSNLYVALSQCNEAIVRCTSEEELFPKICRNAVQLGGMKMAWIGLIDKATSRIKCVASFGDETGFVEDDEMCVRPLVSPCDTSDRSLISEDQPIWHQDLLREPVTEKFRKRASDAGFLGFASLPLRKNNALVGYFTLYASSVNTFDTEVRRLLVEMAMDVSFAMDNFARESERIRAEKQIQFHLGQLESAFMRTVMLAMNLSELRDPYTAGHERRVGRIAKAIAEEMGLDESLIKGIEIAGYLHDLGKITIPTEILVKPGRLTEVEFLLVQGHVMASYNVLKDAEFPWPVAEIALQHHERLDGSGYPRGLSGGDIQLDARILAVADVVEAMASHRPYRPSLGIELALTEIERGRGILFDSTVVEVCIRLFREKGFIISE